MSELLSVAAGIAGALIAAKKISSILRDVKSRGKDAPRQAATLLDEVRGTTEVLASMQPLLSNQGLEDRSRTRVLKIELILAVLTGCVATYSELQELVEFLKRDSIGTLDRAKWMIKEATLSAIAVRLQTHQSSLNLIVVGILNG